jgi:hypothetical protein
MAASHHQTSLSSSSILLLEADISTPQLVVGNYYLPQFSATFSLYQASKSQVSFNYPLPQSVLFLSDYKGLFAEPLCLPLDILNH